MSDFNLDFFLNKYAGSDIRIIVNFVISKTFMSMFGSTNIMNIYNRITDIFMLHIFDKKKCKTHDYVQPITDFLNKGDFYEL